MLEVLRTIVARDRRRSFSSAALGFTVCPVTRGGWISRFLGVALDREDAARLWMDTPENPMVVTALLRLDAPLDFATFEALAEVRALAHARLRARIVPPLLPLLRPRWREEPHASVTRHLEHVRLAPGSGELGIARALSRIASEPLDRERPLWRMSLLQGDDDRSAIAVRIHHAVADGIALLGVLYGFSDEGAGSTLPLAAPSGKHASRTRGDLVRRAGALARLVARPADASPALTGRPCGQKALAWSSAIDVASIRDAAHRVDAHVNDVLLGALAGAVRALVETRGATCHDLVHALVPVALPHTAGALGNRFASMFVRLPTQVDDAVGRVIAAREAMRAARADAGLALGRSLIGAGYAMRERAERVGVRFFSHKASVVASNVAGPIAPLHVAGRRITEIVFAAPTSGSLAVSVNAFSYAGALRVTISTDTAVLSDPWLLARLYEDALHATIVALGDSACR